MLLWRSLEELIACCLDRTDFLITTSIDGHVKFWKKSATGLDFVKHFRSHLGAIVTASVSHDGTLLATAGVDKGLKIFDVVNFGELAF
jgi:peptidylprolyl isomerase domain and WD repeat-containing protein 1